MITFPGRLNTSPMCYGIASPQPQTLGADDMRVGKDLKVVFCVQGAELF